jgi:hypothetical protein
VETSKVVLVMEEVALEVVLAEEVDTVEVREDAAVVAKVEEKEDDHLVVVDSAVEEAMVAEEKEDAVAVVKVAKDAEEAVTNQYT